MAFAISFQIIIYEIIVLFVESNKCVDYVLLKKCFEIIILELQIKF